MSRSISRFAAVVASMAVLLAVAVPVGAADTARVRVLHASPDAPNVDIYLDGAKVDALTNVPFKTISDYLSVPAGGHNVKVVPAGGAPADAVIDADLTFASGKAYTVAATNVVATIEAQLIVDAPTPTASGAQVRVVHFSSDTPAVDVRPDGGDPVVTNLAYPDATGYLALPAGTYDLEVCATGTDTCPLDLDPIPLQAGRSYSVFAIGSLTGQTLTAVLATDSIAAPATDVVDAAPGTFGTTAPVVGGLAMLAVLAALGAYRWLGRRAPR